ncbi:MAG: hypothetical protein WDN48_18325 [Pseudolabrys sp.]
MIRRTFTLMAGATLLAAMLSGPALAQGKKIVVALPGIPPVFSATNRVRRGEGRFLQETRRQR